ncbi:MAG: hypothetical protein ACPHDT_13320 [Acidimicrobiales bacterium]
MKPALQIEGGRKLRRAFREVGDGMSDLRQLHKRLADDVADSAKRKVPVRSGRLERSVRGSGTKTAARVRAGNNRKSGPSSVPYAGPIHFGWGARGIRPQPFLYDALDDRREAVVKAYDEQVREIIRKAF